MNRTLLLVGAVRGEYADEPQYDAGFEFSEGLATVNLGKMRRVIDTRGETVFEVAASSIGPCQEGLMPCETKRKWSYLDRASEVDAAGSGRLHQFALLRS